MLASPRFTAAAAPNPIADGITGDHAARRIGSWRNRDIKEVSGQRQQTVPEGRHSLPDHRG
jgi:hypothetical protein